MCWTGHITKWARVRSLERLVVSPSRSHPWARSLKTHNSKRPLGSSLRSTASCLLVAVVAVAACGSSPSQSAATSRPASTQADVTAHPSPIATKSVPVLDRVVFAGWIGGSPAIAMRKATGQPTWAIRTIGTSGWLEFGELPDGSAPVTDGTTVASVRAPETATGLALAGAHGSHMAVNLPGVAWVEPWSGIHGLVPLVGRSGYLLAGAGAIAIVDDQGNVSATPTPDGFVALAPTSDPHRFLLATTADANEAGALSESTPFTVYLWTVGSKEKPSMVHQHVAATATSTVGLAWLRTADKAWWSLTDDGSVVLSRQANPLRSAISSDGRHVVLFGDSVPGCSILGSAPCQVSLVDQSGSTRLFEGPASGVDFGGANIGMVLSVRPALGLPWRLVAGPVDDPVTTSLE